MGDFDSSSGKKDIFAIAQTLTEVFNDSTALSYYINFLEHIGFLSLIKFWLHVEGFKSAFKSEKNSSAKIDAKNIFNIYLKENSLLSIPIPERLRNIIFARVFCNSEEVVNINCFDEAQKTVFELMVNRYFKEFLHSYFYAKYQLEILQSQQIFLQDILRSHFLLTSFIEYLEEINQRNLLEFVIAVDSFTAELKANNNNSSELQNDAMVIYDRYFSMQATDSLGFSDKIRVEVESGICTDDGCPKLDAFEKPKQEALKILQNNLIPSYLQSSLFLKVISELKSKIEIQLCLSSTPLHNETKNQTTKESSQIVINNQFSNSKKNEKWESFKTHVNSVTNNKVSKNLCHKTEQTRKEKCSSLAQIDEFGRYTSLFDNTVLNCKEMNQISARYRLKNTLEKYLNQTAAKESLVADEVAQLIISDIRNMVAMGSNRDK